VKRVLVESPYRGDGWELRSAEEQAKIYRRNQAYARACLLHSLRLGEAPFAMHLLFPQVLDDTDTAERRLGISAGLAWSHVADLIAVYEDLGVSSGMVLAVARADELGIPVVRRSGIWDEIPEEFR